ncbi:MAG TPA: hypothetical protein VG122_05485 [Gemmata sp.]|jgi:hypothetical protein|nr:hypothetical protein [Gemmata sp.]
MRFRFTIVAICGLMGGTIAGCTGSAPPPVAPAVPAEKPKTDDLQSFEGNWILKSSLGMGSAGTYSLNRSDGAELIFRIRDGVMEMRVEDEQWVKSATLALGAEPQCLLSSKSDASGQKRVIQLRYKLEGNTLITVQDNLYLDVLPDSFDIKGGGDRQRQIDTYVRTDR